MECPICKNPNDSGVSMCVCCGYVFPYEKAYRKSSRAFEPVSVIDHDEYTVLMKTAFNLEPRSFPSAGGGGREAPLQMSEIVDAVPQPTRRRSFLLKLCLSLLVLSFVFFIGIGSVAVAKTAGWFQPTQPVMPTQQPTSFFTSSATPSLLPTNTPQPSPTPLPTATATANPGAVPPDEQNPTVTPTPTVRSIQPPGIQFPAQPPFHNPIPPFGP